MNTAAGLFAIAAGLIALAGAIVIQADLRGPRRTGWLTCAHPSRAHPKTAHEGTSFEPARPLGWVWRCPRCARRYVLHEHNDNVGSAWVQWCRRWLPWPR